MEKNLIGLQCRGLGEGVHHAHLLRRGYRRLRQKYLVSFEAHIFPT
jgi:hypothetical protein